MLSLRLLRRDVTWCVDRYTFRVTRWPPFQIKSTLWQHVSLKRRYLYQTTRHRVPHGLCGNSHPVYRNPQLTSIGCYLRSILILSPKLMPSKRSVPTVCFYHYFNMKVPSVLSYQTARRNDYTGLLFGQSDYCHLHDIAVYVRHCVVICLL
jgi:hypothetical protein